MPSEIGISPWFVRFEREQKERAARGLRPLTPEEYERYGELCRIYGTTTDKAERERVVLELAKLNRRSDAKPISDAQTARMMIDDCLRRTGARR